MTPTLTLSPLFGTSVGFDRFDYLFDTLTRHQEPDDGQPAYNIERHGEDLYTVTLAVPGFDASELNVSVRDNDLIVVGERPETNPAARQYLHRGFGLGPFRRNFRLADYVVVKSADLTNGLLRIELAREVPEAQQSRKIEIRTKPRLEAIESADKKAA